MTSTYFDTSAIVRLLVRGRVGHQRARTAWLEATDAASVSITYAEARAAVQLAAACEYNP